MGKKRMEHYNFHKERCKSIGVMPIDWETFKRLFNHEKSKEENDLAAEELLQKISHKFKIKWRMKDEP